MKRGMYAKVGAGVAALAISGGVALGVANAQTSGATIQPPSTTQPAQPTQPGQQGQQGQRPNQQQLQQERDAFIADVARRLNVTPDALTNAFRDAGIAQVDRRLAAGQITQAQADRIKQALQSGNLRGLIGGFGGFGGGDHGGGPGRMGGRDGAGMALGRNIDALATFLGTTAQQLRTELPGKSLAQVAQARGKTRDQLKTFLTTQFDTELTQAVQNGRRTQAQADEARTRFTQNLDQMIDRQFPATLPGGPRSN